MPSPPKVGAVCLNRARTDLRRGRWVTCVPTAISEVEHDAPDHHGYPRAFDLIRVNASMGQTCHQGSVAPGRPFSISSLPLADLGGKRVSSGSCYVSSSGPVPCSIRRPFPWRRPCCFHSTRLRARLARQGHPKGPSVLTKPSKREAQAGWDALAMPLRISKSRPRANTPKRCGRACWPARSPAYWDAGALRLLDPVHEAVHRRRYRVSAGRHERPARTACASSCCRAWRSCRGSNDLPSTSASEPIPARRQSRAPWLNTSPVPMAATTGAGDDRADARHRHQPLAATVLLRLVP